MRTSLAALRLAQHDPLAALAALAPVLDGSAPLLFWPTWLTQAFLLEAAARDALTDEAAAGRALERALDIAEPDHALLIFLLCPAPGLLQRHARRRTAHPALIADILSLLAGNRPAPPPAGPRPPMDQHGRAHRASQIPPAEFWSTAAAYAAPGDQAALGDTAHDRGLYREAAQLHKNAAASGNPRAVLYLSDPPACLRADPRPAYWAAAHAVDEPGFVAFLLGRLRQAGADEQAAALAARAAAHAALDDLLAVGSLLDSLREAGADEHAAALSSRAAAHAALHDSLGVGSLPDRLRAVGADDQAAALLARDPAAHTALHDPARVGSLLNSLRRAGADEQAAALLARDPAAHAALHDPTGVAVLLNSLREGGADEQAAALLARDPAAHTALHDPAAVAVLLNSLRDAGAHDQAAALAGRLPAAGMFELFLEQKGLTDQFRFGRDADGTPAAPWGWEDLDLWLVPRPQGEAAPARR